VTRRSAHLDEKHDALRMEIRSRLAGFADELGEWEAQSGIPRAVWRKLGAWGYLDLPSSGPGLFESMVFLEELGRTGYSGFRAAVGVHAYMATHYVRAHGSADVRRKYLPGAATGDLVAALAITEADAGSDLAALATTGSVTGDGVVVDGVKTLVTNGIAADVHIVAVRSGPSTTGPTGLSLVAVDADAPGVTVTPRPIAAWRACGTADVRYDGAPGTLLGRAGSGFYYLMRGLPFERLVAATLALGGAEQCLAATTAHLRSRHAFGGPLAALQSVRHTVAGLATRLAAARHLVHDTAWRFSEGELPVAEAAMAKLYATETACVVADECLRLHGAAGYATDSAVLRAHTEARAATVAAGPSEVMLDLVAASVLDQGA
jgi:acyl-CoA dehydrogenase